MALYRLEIEGEGREIYVVEAFSPEAARQIFEDGDAGQPELAEITGAEVVKIEEDTETDE